jgi:hypothetical protein
MKKPLNLWEGSLKTIFDLPASVVIIEGDWRQGKTDFSLFIAQELERLHIIKKFASNVRLSDPPENFSYIDNMNKLKRWSWSDKLSKLMIYDEGTSSTPKRRAMSKLNVEWLTYLPQLSKGNVKLIAICQETKYFDSVFYDTIFCRALFHKINKKTAYLTSKLIDYPRIEFTDIPKSRLNFDPFNIAQFDPEGKIALEDGDSDQIKMLKEFCEHGNYSKIAKPRNLHVQQVKRAIITTIKELLIKSQ